MHRPDIDLCAAHVRQMEARGGGLLLICGPAGIGKSTLARAVQQVLRPQGALWVGATHPDLEPALGLWSRLSALTDADHDVNDAAHEDRFGAAVRLLRRVSSRDANPIAFDDLHAADPDSLTLLAHLAPVLEATGATIIATSRGAEAVADTLGRAAHRAVESQAQVHELTPFTTDQVRQRLVRWADGATVPDAVVHTFTRESGGNPLVLEGLLHDCWPAAGALPHVCDIETASTGPSVVDRWRRQLEHLSPADRTVLGAVVELGANANVRLIGLVVGAPVPAATFERLAAHGVVAPVASDGQVTLAHPAVAEALVAMDGPTSPAVHERLAQELARAGADSRTVLSHMIKAQGRFSAQ